MNLKFKLFGHTIWSLEADFGEAQQVVAAPLAAKGTKWMSNLWLKGMMR